MSKHKTPAPPATMPAEAVGFLAVHPSRPGRLSVCRVNGTIENSFSPDDTQESLAALLPAYGFAVLADGSVVRV